MRAFRRWAALALLAVLATGCGGPSQTGTGGTGPAPGYYEASWAPEWEAANPNAMPAAASATLKPDGTATFSADCNPISATISETRVVVDAMTEMGCPAGSFEPLLLENLQAGVLRESSPGSFQVGNLVFTRLGEQRPTPARVVAGGYDVGIEERAGEAVSFRPIGVALVDDSSTVAVTAGCNLFTSHIGEGGLLGEVTTTGFDCPDDTNEAALLAQLLPGAQVEVHSESVFWIGALQFTANDTGTSVSATWRIDPANVPTVDDTAIAVLVTRAECNSGVTGTVNPPVIEERRDAVVVTFSASPPSLGTATCPANDEVPVTVHLDEPIGQRQLIDGICTADRQLASTIWCQTDVRFDPQHGVVESTWPRNGTDEH